MKLLLVLQLVLISVTGLCQSGWGEWQNISNYSGLTFRVQYSHFNKHVESDRKHVWKVEVQNDYGSPAKISIAVTANNIAPEKGYRRSTIKPGGTKVFGSMFSTAPEGQQIFVHWKNIQGIEEDLVSNFVSIPCSSGEIKQVSIEHIHGTTFRLKEQREGGVILTVNVDNYKEEDIAQMLCENTSNSSVLNQIKTTIRQSMIEMMEEFCEKNPKHEWCIKKAKTISDGIRG